MNRNIEEVNKPDGKLERSIKTPEGHEYIFYSGHNNSNNPNDTKIVCKYFLGGIQKYSEYLIYIKDLEKKN